MKRISALLVFMLLIAFLAGCQDEPADAAEAPAAEAAVQEEEPTAVPPTAEPAPTDEPAPAEEPAEETAEEEPMEETADAGSSGLPAAELMNDEGGPVRLVGGADFTDFTVSVTLMDPAPALLDMVYTVQGDRTQFAPVENQILGTMTDPADVSPLAYVFDLPQVPRGTFLDVDNDGEEDMGVQIFNLAMGANINGGSHLEQLDQVPDLNSFLRDTQSGNITEGSLLVYAADDAQGFPSGFGDDGILFTEDDPAVGLPAGYTVVHFGPDGFTFDRSAEAELNVLEAAEAASSDFSEQGLVESFNSLIDELAVRYSFTEFRNIDWEAKRAEYLPAIEEAEAAAGTNPQAAILHYGDTLFRMAQSIRDAHVASVPANNPALIPQFVSTINQPIAMNVGANTTELDDGRIIVTDVLAGSPAEGAGWTFGTEIVSVDGVANEERIPTILYNDSTGTDEGQRLQQVANLLKWPAGTAEVTVDAILPGETAPQSFTLATTNVPLPDRLASLNKRGSSPTAMPIMYEYENNIGYVNWEGFHAAPVRMAVWEEFLSTAAGDPGNQGLILDMRGNGGGWDLLYFTMASYFFNEDNAVSMHWIDQDAYDAEAGDLVPRLGPDYLLSAPSPELYYDGPLFILVDNKCASSCEFFTQFLQTNGRATVIGQYGTKGAGAPINSVDLPGGIVFNYTKGRAYFAGTDEFNLEAKGVTPDIRVPTTEENELAKLEGGDPVLATAVAAIGDAARQTFVEALTFAPLPAEVTPGFAASAPDGWTRQPTSSGVNVVGGVTGVPQLQFSVFTDSTIVDTLAPTGIDLDEDLVDTREAGDLNWSIYDRLLQQYVYRYAMAEGEDGSVYAVTLVSHPADADAYQEGILYPVLDSYTSGTSDD